ncbi:putative MmpL efflux pump [Paratrimastix pyriformis]|uniref:MmpL efflux pump n=1 Tax=Paratrimastix pyriformis TaxID=342808 RepID=A0ABQ8UK02_9EUKA|nr:putative MmpL efflux pump [Paratrimastix pyriformis]
MLLLPIAKWVWQVASFAPSLMMSCAVAMSFDYSLFLLSRFKEELMQGHRTVPDAVRVMLTHAGRIIVLSNSTCFFPCLTSSRLFGAPFPPQLAISFLGLCFFPLDIIATMGFGSAFSLVITALVNLTFTPALLLAFPNFFADFTYFGMGCCCLPCVKRQCLSHPCCDCCTNPSGFKPLKGIAVDPRTTLPVTVLAGSLPPSPMAPPPPPPPARDSEDEAEETGGDLRAALMAEARARQKKSFWFRSGHASTGCCCAWLILAAALLLCGPLGYEAYRIRGALDTTEVLPRDSNGLAVFLRLCQDFAPGRIGPYTLLIECPTPEADTPIMTDAFFDMVPSAPSALIPHSRSRGEFGDDFQMVEPLPLPHVPWQAHALVALMTDPNGPDGQGRLMCDTCMSGITNAGTMEVPLELAQACVDPTSEAYESDLCFAYRMLYDRYANPNGTAAFFELQADLNPFGDGNEEWIERVRIAMANFSSTYQPPAPNHGPALLLYLFGTAVQMKDAIDTIYRLFPYMISATVCVIIVLVAVVFRSLMVPLRLVVSLLVTLVMVFGSAVLVFQDGRKYVAYLWPAVGRYSSMYWFVPIMGFSIVVGLGLDYDIFLFSRVYEYRKRGYGDRAALTKAIYKTGAIITAAGCIMALAFSGLMISQEMVLNQFGFVLCWSVILDTFFVRTLLVPAIVSLVGRLPGRWNWWPGRVPEGTKGELDQEDEFEGAVLPPSPSPPPAVPAAFLPPGVGYSTNADFVGGTAAPTAPPPPQVDERTPLIADTPPI